MSLCRYQFSELGDLQIVERPCQFVHADRVVMVVLIDARIAGEHGVVDVAVAGILKTVTARATLAFGIVVDIAAAVLVGVSPRIVGPFVDLLQIDGHFKVGKVSCRRGGHSRNRYTWRWPDADWCRG